MLIVAKMQSRNVARQHAVLSFAELCDNGTTTYSELQHAFVDAAVPRALAFHWLGMFPGERTVIKHEQYGLHPSTWGRTR